ncbi:MAG: YicC family protein [Clostridia bacterium]|nr:YicC family protein [Clostridia bacterium]
MNSMTAFGRGVLENEARAVTVEMRSVNNRFLDLTVRLPRAYICFEEQIKNYLQSRGIKRGKLDVTVTIEKRAAQSNLLEPDFDFATSYVEALRALRDGLGLTDDISVMRVASRAEVFRLKREEEDEDAILSDIMAALKDATDGFLARRAQEGANTSLDIQEKMKNVMQAAEEIEALAAEHVRDVRAHLEERIRTLMADVVPDESRLLTECALYADRLAIDEELARLKSHYQAFLSYLDSEEPVGRPLDFLLQEFNRETNTIGSKASHATIARLVVRMKTELEKIREQIQNLE